MYYNDFTLINRIDSEQENYVVAVPTVGEETAAMASFTELSIQSHSRLFQFLTKHSPNWREIGLHLGFHSYELENIQARPPLWNTAPNSWLSAMLAEWLEWAPGDGRGSTSIVTMEALREALNKAGFTDTAKSIIDTSESLKSST